MIPLFLFLSYPLLDSLISHYSLYQPDTIQLTAKCSIAQDTVFEVRFVKGVGLKVDGPPLARELVRGALLLTGIGLPELYRDFGGTSFLDTLIVEGNWWAIVPKDTFLFSKAKLKVEDRLIKEAKIRAEGQNISLKITYDSGLPVNIDILADTLKYIISHKYKASGADHHKIPEKTEIISPEKKITITYK